MTREELVDKTIKDLKDTTNVAIQAATGVGKSKIAIELCKLYANNSEQKILLVVAEIAHINNWKEELVKWGFNQEITIICYASLKKYMNTSWDIVIFDEAHHLGSELRLDIYSTLSSNHYIFLSATLKDTLLAILEMHCGDIKTVKIGLQDAISANILPKPKINLIPLILDNKIYNHTIVEEWGKESKRIQLECKYSERWKYLRNKKRIPAARLTIICTQQQKYDYLTEQFLYYKKRYLMIRNEAIKNKWLQYGSKRKIFLGAEKTTVVSNLIKRLKDKRFICFCTNINQAELLGKDNAVHSKKKNNLEIIQKFNDKEINNIFAVGMLQEGMNLKDIEAGIIVQLDGEERAFIQKFGRTLRADSPEQYIIYFRATRDEEYLNNALENIDKKYIQIYEVNN